MLHMRMRATLPRPRRRLLPAARTFMSGSAQVSKNCTMLGCAPTTACAWASCERVRGVGEEHRAVRLLGTCTCCAAAKRRCYKRVSYQVILHTFESCDPKRHPSSTSPGARLPPPRHRPHLQPSVALRVRGQRVPRALERVVQAGHAVRRAEHLAERAAADLLDHLELDAAVLGEGAGGRSAGGEHRGRVRRVVGAGASRNVRRHAFRRGRAYCARRPTARQQPP